MCYKLTGEYATEKRGQGLRDSFELMKEAGLAEASQVRVTGGGAKSPLWRQILADVLDVELVTVNTTEGAAHGAAVLAATGAGRYPDVPAACATIIATTPAGTLAPLTPGHSQ